MKISQVTSVGWCANMMLDRQQAAPFTLGDLYAAADDGRVVDLFLKIDDGGIIQLWADQATARAAMEHAFRDAIEALRGREVRKAGVSDNPLCVVIAVVLEAIQQNFAS